MRYKSHLISFIEMLWLKNWSYVIKSPTIKQSTSHQKSLLHETNAAIYLFLLCFILRTCWQMNLFIKIFLMNLLRVVERHFPLNDLFGWLIRSEMQRSIRSTASGGCSALKRLQRSQFSLDSKDRRLKRTLIITFGLLRQRPTDKADQRWTALEK